VRGPRFELNFFDIVGGATRVAIIHDKIHRRAGVLTSVFESDTDDTLDLRIKDVFAAN
jgi:hypothetical protein